MGSSCSEALNYCIIAAFRKELRLVPEYGVDSTSLKEKLVILSQEIAFLSGTKWRTVSLNGQSFENPYT